jgi:Tfp pilus assembly protein PilF/GTP-binding protein EngB required for normal cell division
MSLWSRFERRINDLADGLVLDEYRGQLDEARQLLRAGDHRRATEVLEALLAVKPDHGQALILLGEVRLADRDVRAKDAFDKALAVRPGDPSALVGFGLALVAIGSYEAAIVPLGRAVSEAGGDRTVLADAYRGLGVAWRRRGDLDKAVRELRKAVAEDNDDDDARASLGEALVASGAGLDEARRHLDRVVAGEAPPPLALYALARLALDEGDHAVAAERLAKARELATATTALDAALRLDILLAQGDTALAQADAMRAHVFYLEALDQDPRRADTHARIAATHRMIGNLEAAVVSYDRALGLGAATHVLRAAVDAAIAADDAPRMMAWGADLLGRTPDDTRALVARGIATAQTQPDAARVLLELAAARDDVDAHVELARIAPTPALAAVSALAALRVAPHHARARALLADARGREQPVTPGVAAGDIADVATYLERAVAGRRDLGHLVGDVARAAAGLDTPLLVTVMGEFSSGKSTFVNAFIGADVAPTGITPTTATINVVRYGRDRGGRVILKTGATVDLGWDALMTHLRELSPQAARDIDRVEILVPLPQLEKINIVDTPGLNSIQPEHEATARGFIAKADAVVWVFTASQGGKASERKALETIRDDGKRVLGVLNKADQLSTAERDEVVTFISGSLGGLVETVVAVSARDALDWKRAGGEARADDGNWSAVMAALEQRFFAQARELKRAACARSLRGVVNEAQTTLAVVRERYAAATASARNGRDELAAASAGFARDTVLAERKALSEHVTTLYRRASREVLDLVRPRRLPFSSNTATNADRDYLIALLASGFEAAIEGGRARVAADLTARGRLAEHAARALAAALDADVGSDLERVAADRIGLALSRVYDRARAYVRGYLDGGHVEMFFKTRVPTLELAEDAVYHALVQTQPDLDRELGVALARACGDALAAVAARLDHWAAAVDVQSFDLDVGVARSLETAAVHLA